MSADAPNEPTNLQQVDLVVDTEQNCVNYLGENYYNNTIEFCNAIDPIKSTCLVILI